MPILIGLLAVSMLLNAKSYYLTHLSIYAIPSADTIEITDSRITCIGTASTCPNDRVLPIVDAKGFHLLPGFIDSHTHIAYAALLKHAGLDLSAVKGKEQILHAIKSHADEHPEKNSILGFGVFPYVMGMNGPNKSQLDGVVPDRPVVILSQNGHAAWFNSKAIRIADIRAETIDNAAHRYHYVLDDQGEPTGFMLEGEAFFPHFKKLGFADKAVIKNALKQFLPELSRHGITTIVDAGAAGIEEALFEALVELDSEDDLPTRYMASHILIDTQDDLEAVSKLQELQNRYHSEHFHVGGIKIMLDGENDDGDHFIHYSTDQLSDTIKPLLRHHINLMIHTTIDRSTHLAIDAIEKARKGFDSSQSRITLAHVNMVRDTDFKRMADNGLIANIQPFNARADGFLEYRYVEYGEAWEEKLARYATFFEHGITVSASSDFPACNGPLESCVPLASIESAVTRKKPGAPLEDEGLAGEHEALNVNEAIRAYTMGGAYQLSMEKQLGSITVGKKADLVLLEHNPEKVPLDTIATIKVLMTMMDGEIVYKTDF